MAIFSAIGTKAVTTTAGLGPLSIESATPNHRGKLLYWNVSCSDAPADHAVTIEIQRQTATGTGTAVTVAIMDQADLVANVVATCKSNLTVTPTITANTVVFKRAFNTKYGLDIYAPPGAEIIYPATAASGIVWDTPIAPTTGDNIIVYAEVHEY